MLCGDEEGVRMYIDTLRRDPHTVIMKDDTCFVIRKNTKYLCAEYGSTSPYDIYKRLSKNIDENEPLARYYIEDKFNGGIINRIYEENSTVQAICTFTDEFDISCINMLINKLEKYAIT